MKRFIFCLLLCCLALVSCQSQSSSPKYTHSCDIIKYGRDTDQNGRLYTAYNEWNENLDCSGTWDAGCSYSRAGKTLGAIGTVTISNFSIQAFDIEIPREGVPMTILNSLGSSHFTLTGENEDGDLIYTSTKGDRIEFQHSTVDGCHICMKYYMGDGSLLAWVDILPW